MEELFPEVPRLEPPPFSYPDQYRCNWCTTTYCGDEVRVAFYRDPNRGSGKRLVSGLKPKCRLCSIEERSNRKSEDIDRDLHKARSTTRHHYLTFRV